MTLWTYTTDGCTGLVSCYADGTTGHGMTYASARVDWLRLMVGE